MCWEKTETKPCLSPDPDNEERKKIRESRVPQWPVHLPLDATSEPLGPSFKYMDLCEGLQLLRNRASWAHPNNCAKLTKGSEYFNLQLEVVTKNTHYLGY